MNVMEKLAQSKRDLEDFYREQRENPPIGQSVEKIDYGEDDESGDIFQGREDDEHITSERD